MTAEDRTRTSHSILVVEDDEQVRGLIRKTLERAGYDVCEAANGQEATRSSRMMPFDLVITDILMPEQDGIETIVRLRKDSPRTKIIAISGAPDPLFLANAAGLGATSVLQKPFAPQQLVKLVGDALGVAPAC